MTTTMTAAEMLAAHTECWDMPTLAERYPEVMTHLAERYEVHFGMVSEILVIDKATGAHEWMQTADGKPCFDVRVAVETLLCREADRSRPMANHPQPETVDRVECPQCHGFGEVAVTPVPVDPANRQTRPCSLCRGEGEVPPVLLDPEFKIEEA
jgi:hypothetical protein